MSSDEFTPQQQAELEAMLEAKLAEIKARYPKLETPERLTPEVIRSTSDDRLEELILQFVAARMPTDFVDTDFGWLEALPQSVQLAYASMVVGGEIENGGFNQMFFNGTDALAAAAVDAFKRMGADEYAALIAESLVRAEQNAGKLARSWGSGSMESFMESYGEEIFRDLDDRLYELAQSSDISTRRVAWIRSNPADFTTA